VGPVVARASPPFIPVEAGSLGDGVNLSDVATRKFHRGCRATPRGIRSDEYGDAGRFCLIERVRQSPYFVTHQLAAIRIG
jgi:hypothetical protein